MTERNENIKAPVEHNETWNTCPHCGHEWKDAVPIPGLLHRIRSCELCRSKLYKEVHKHMERK